MSAVKTPPIPFGRHLGAAARASSDLLDAIMIRESERAESWIALNLIATSGPGKRRDELVHDLVFGLRFPNDAPAAQVLGQLERQGLIRFDADAGGDGGLVEMTPAGEERFAHLFGVITETSARALRDIDPEDVQTTIRVLGQYREQALDLIAG